MALPSQVYCATMTNGVYYTSTFTAANPVWAAVNGGLPATDVRQFALDPFAPNTKQYLLLKASRTLYRRDNGGNWAAILTNAQAATLCSVPDMDLRWFCTDQSIPGRLWVSSHYNTGGSWKWLYALWSDDYGTTWTGTAGIDHTTFWDNYYDISNPQAYGDLVFIGTIYDSALPTTWYSTDKGANWAAVGLGALNCAPQALNPLQPTLSYIQGGKVDNAGALTALANLTNFGRADAIWFSASAAGHHRSVGNARVFSTSDSWATVNTPSAISPVPISIAPWVGSDEDDMIVGLTRIEASEGVPSQPHIIGTLYGESDVTAVGKAGANCETTPFADSIPDTCGGVAVGGIAALPIAAHIYVGEVTFV